MNTLRRSTGALRRAARVLGLLAAAQAATAAGTPEAAAKFDDLRLKVPAAPTARAAGSAMLAVATAGTRLLAAGERGLLIRSDDCGRSWAQSEVPVSVTLTALRFVDGRQGHALGHAGVVLGTDDGGAHWRLLLDGHRIALAALAAAAGGSAEARANAERLVADGPDKPLFALHFWTPQRGIVVGAYGIALATQDGGQNWQWIGERIPNPKGLHLYGLWVQGDQVTVVGEQGFVARSDDGARSFNRVASPYAGSFFGLASLGGDDLLVYGLRGNAFLLSTRTPAGAMRPVATGLQAVLVTAQPTPDGGALLFDGDGRMLTLQGAAHTVQPAGASPVGPVLGSALPTGCGDAVALAGLRGVSVIPQPVAGTARREGAAK